MKLPTKPAVFLDRDGTLIVDPGYLNDPDQVALLPHAAEAVRRINEAEILAIVVTNQSGIARGLLSLETYQAIERQVDRLLEERGAHLDAHYFCPHLPEISGPCLCRKPGTLLYQQAAERFAIDLSRSWWIGDRLRDIEPARALGGHGILLASRSRVDDDLLAANDFAVAPDLAAAVDLVLAKQGADEVIADQ